MRGRKEKLYKYLKERNYFDLEESLSVKTKNAGRLSKPPSARQEKEKMVKAVKRFQTFSALPPTGRVNKPTLQETEKPRCGFPDITARESAAMAESSPRWDETRIRYSFRNFTQQLPRDVIRAEVTKAFNEWRRVFSTFDFREVSMNEDPMIVIRFVVRDHLDSIDFNGSDGDLAHAFLPNSIELPGHIHFDDEERWGVIGTATIKDLLTVAIHEIGHAIGLIHSNNENALMFATYKGVRRTLHSEDIARIRNLYG